MKSLDLDNTHSFSNLLSHYFEMLNEDDEDLVDTHNFLLRMLEKNQVNPSEVIQALHHTLLKYPEKTILILQFMKAIINTSRLFSGYSYPEIFWLIIDTHLLNQTDKIYDIMSIISSMCDHNVLRGFLTYKLFLSTKENLKGIVKSFYYVGHTIESLHILIGFIPFTEENYDIYETIYLHAADVVNSSSNSKNDIEFLSQFFKVGSVSEHETIAQISNKALHKLNNAESQI